MIRRVRALIDLAALKANFAQSKAAAPQSRVMAVIKANAYGHGVLRVAHALANADAFALASLDEALVLRTAGVAKRLIVLGGVYSADELTRAVENNVELVVHSEEQLRLLESASLSTSVGVWLKVDTGMHRLGVAPGKLKNFYQRLCALKYIKRPLVIMTHFASADEEDDQTTPLQLKQFQASIAGTEAEYSCANSAALLKYPAAHFDWVRPGIMLYGVSPFASSTACAYDLLPVMTLESRIIAVNSYQRGDAIGYAGTWTCPEDMPVGVVAIGYADGYPRHAPSGTPVLVNGKRASLIGRVSMDMITVDLRGIGPVRAGDPAVLWGRGLPVENIAARAGTIAYELLCKVTTRVPFEIEE